MGHTTRQNNRPGRHTGFKAVSTGRQGDAGEQDKPTILPLSLDGRGSKPVPVPDTGVRVNKSKTTTYRHSRVGGKPQGGRVTRVNKTTPTDRIPSPLMGEESKVRVTKPLTLGSEGDSKTVPPRRHSRVGGNPQGRAPQSISIHPMKRGDAAPAIHHTHATKQHTQT